MISVLVTSELLLLKMLRATLITICFLVFSDGTPAIKPIRREHPSNRIIGGGDTDIEKAPFVAALEIYFSNGDSMPFGAALITPTFAVTMATYILPSVQYRVRVGSSKSNDGGVVVPVKRFILHPKYQGIPHIDYDVALIELESPVTLNEQTQTIAIADNEPNTGDLVTYFGWGQNDPNGDLLGTADVLQSVQVSIWDRQTCNETYTKNEEWAAGNITERVICAGAAESRGCLLDAGDPLVMDNKLVGILTWGAVCMMADLPPVFTNLLNDEIRDFIREKAGV